MSPAKIWSARWPANSWAKSMLTVLTLSFGLGLLYTVIEAIDNWYRNWPDQTNTIWSNYPLIKNKLKKNCSDQRCMWLSRHRTGQCQKLWPKYLQNEAWALFFPFVASPLACTAPKPSVALDYCGQRHFYLDIAHMQNHMQRPLGEWQPGTCFYPQRSQVSLVL